MNSETQTIEYKSLQKIRTGDKGFKDLSTTCVALANAQGGQIFIGYDDKKRQVLPNQVITADEVNNAVTRLRSLCFNVALYASEILSDETGSQYFIITVSPSMKSVASTSDGKFYMRFADKCEPVRSEDILRLSEIKGCFQWEITRSRFHIDNASRTELHALAEEIIPLLDYVMKYYQLKQKEFTAFGIIAREQKIYATELSQELQLSSDERLRSYVNMLVKKGLVLQKGVHKGSYYIVNPLLIKNAKADKIPTTLKTIDSDVLESLILHDLEKHPMCKLSEIASRLPDVDIKEVRKLVYALVGKRIRTEGAKTNRRYSLI